MTLSEMVDFICDKVSLTDSDSLASCRQYLKARHEMIWRSYCWRDSEIVLSVTASSEEVILPHILEHPRLVRWGDGTVLRARGVDYVLMTDSQAFDRTGIPTTFSQLSQVGTKAHPGGGKMRLRSTSALDVSLTVEIRGEERAVLEYETVLLNGTAEVETSGGYDLINSLSKPSTAGELVVEDEAGSLELLRLRPDETERSHSRIWLLEPPLQEKGVLVLGKRRIRPFQGDNDVPALPRAVDALVAYGHGDMLQKQRQYAKAGAMFDEARAHVARMIDEERHQSGHVVMLVPEEPGFAWS